MSGSGGGNGGWRPARDGWRVVLEQERRDRRFALAMLAVTGASLCAIVWAALSWECHAGCAVYGDECMSVVPVCACRTPDGRGYVLEQRRDM